MNLYGEVNKARIKYNSNTGMPLEKIILNEVQDWERSKRRKEMIKGKKYYAGNMKIEEKQRMAIAEHGRRVEDKNVSNVKLKHNFAKKLNRQKVSYLLSEQMRVQTENENYLDLLEDIFDKGFHKLLKNTMTEAINTGIAWIYPYLEDDKIKFKRLDSTEIIPLWEDREHSRLDAFIRVFDMEEYQGEEKKIVTRVELYDKDRIYRWILDGNNLIEDVEMYEKYGQHYIVIEDGDNNIRPVSWDRVPLVYFKYNDLEQPLISMIDTLVDDYNMQRSLNSDMILDTPNSIMHVRNYDGQNPGEFRKNLSLYRTGFTSDDGDMESIDVNINTEAYEKHIKTTRKEIFEHGGGVDTNFDSFGNSPSGIALEILYQDLDLDCNEIETEFQASLEYLMNFINVYILDLTGQDFTDEKVTFIFTRNKLSNEREMIQSLNESYKTSSISLKTLTERHPYAAEDELERIKEEEEDLDDEIEQYIIDLESRGIDDSETKDTETQ